MNIKIKTILILLVIVAIITVFASNTKTGEEKKVVVYVAHDQDYSEPILREFEETTGIKVEALYDTEATKTVGLVNRILAERNNPKADVFWNNEPIRSVMLKREGLLQPYCSPNSLDIPSVYKDDECFWIGFAARARVLIYNTEKISEEEAPKSIFDLTDSKWKGRVCVANPLFGSTSTHFASLFAVLGESEAKKFLLDLKKNNVKIVESNSMVRDQVVAGECWIGLTDTDDAYDAVLAGKPVKMIFPDQGENDIGDLVFPNTIMLITGAPHSEEGKKLIDFLLTSRVEEELAKSAMQIPLKSSSKVPNVIPGNIKPLNVTFEEMFDYLDISNKFAQETFIQ